MTHLLTIPETLYERLKAYAQTVNRTVDEVAEDALSIHLPPSVEDDLPEAIRNELQAMEQLSDDVLWQIAESSMNPDKVALYDLLLERHREQSLTAAGRVILDQVRDEANVLMLRKAHAYLLLQARGYRLPDLDELENRAYSQR